MQLGHAKIWLFAGFIADDETSRFDSLWTQSARSVFCETISGVPDMFQERLPFENHSVLDLATR